MARIADYMTPAATLPQRRHGGRAGGARVAARTWRAGGRGRARRRRLGHLPPGSDHARSRRDARCRCYRACGQGRAHRRAGRHPGQHAGGRPRCGQALAAGPNRPAGDQGRGRHVSAFHAGARDRGAGARAHPRRPRRSAGASPPSSAATSAKLVPGSTQAAELKRVLIEQGAWSQYLEVGIGPDAEIFTKAQPMAAVGHGMEAGLHPISTWNNPEPEVVLVVTSQGRNRRRHARQRRQPARRGGPLGAAAVEGQGQQCLDRHRARSSACSMAASRSTPCAASR